MENKNIEMSIIDYFLFKKCRIKNDYVRKPLTENLAKRWASESEKYENDLEGWLQSFVNLAYAI